jgi:hypothetical protein
MKNSNSNVQTTSECLPIGNNMLADADFSKSNLPKGFVKMDFYRCYPPKELRVWENQIIRLIIRDYYLLYSKEIHFGNLIKLNFYCRPQDQISIIFLMGNYSQLAFSRYKKSTLKLQTHQVPENYPYCIQVSV